jgi:NAD(P)-dependent dehydrogenase (short-subunit alcohol dehydrogenase family)
MDQLRFDGRTAIVTGAGGNPSLGRAHALLLASRGASLVINDIGRSKAPNYAGEASAEAVAAEIRAAGGKAVADTHSVADEQGAAAIVQTALDAFGGVDIVVNNAGVSIAAAVDAMTPADFRLHIEVNLLGPWYLARAAWPNMKAAGYGRIVNITSASMAGYAQQAAYAASKGGLWSLTRTLATEGEPLGIKANAVNPGAFTRMVSATLEEDSPLLEFSRENLPPELSSPAVALLAHESCPVTGECIEAVGGEVFRHYMARTPGIVDRDHTIETLAERWDEIMAGASDGLIGLAGHDTSGWKVRPYLGTSRD